MIGFWNRREVFIGNSLQKFSETREMLEGNAIKYKYKVASDSHKSAFATTRARTSSFGQNMDFSRTYYIYVHKKDYEKASFILR